MELYNLNIQKRNARKLQTVEPQKLYNDEDFLLLPCTDPYTVNNNISNIFNGDQEWKPRYGYKRGNDESQNWMLEVPQNAGILLTTLNFQSHAKNNIVSLLDSVN